MFNMNILLARFLILISDYLLTIFQFEILLTHLPLANFSSQAATSSGDTRRFDKSMYPEYKI